MIESETAEPAPDRSADGALTDWLVQRGLQGGGMATLVSGYCDRLAAAGVPILRVFAGVQTLHPLYGGYSYIWHRGQRELTKETFSRNQQAGDDYLNSPFHDMLVRGDLTRHERLDQPLEHEFPVYDEFRKQGATDYYVRIVGFGPDEDGSVSSVDNDGLIVSWLTDRPGGFTDDDVALIERTHPIFALAMRTEATTETAQSVAATYLGRDPGQRVLDGAIDRGSVTSMQAVIYFADLRGFTKLAQDLPATEVVEMLNGYLDCLARPVMDAGGEVLKFLGDGVLAVFEIDGQGPELACQTALAASRRALNRVAKLNRRRRQAGQPVMETDLALHLGDVMYGNVGVQGRLDFTVIGPAVNEASRIEGACRQLDRHLLASEVFYRAVAGLTDSLVSVGRHQLRDIAQTQELFGLPPTSPGGDG